MAFKAGSIYGEALLDTTKWMGGLASLRRASGIAVTAIATAFVAGMTLSIKKGNEFQIAMANVSTIVDETAISTQQLTKDLLNLDPVLGNATELTNALYQSFSSGADTAEEAMQTTVDAAKFGVAALTDTATAVDILTSAVNAYGKDAMTTTRASDLFFTAIREGKLTGESLAGSIGQSIPLFASAKIGLDELAAGMAAMTKQGVAANETTTQLNAIINQFLKPQAALTALLQEFGFESGSAFLEAEGLAGALKLLEDATAGDAAELAKLLPNIRAMRGAMALTGVGGEEFTAILGEMENAAGATETAFAKQERTFKTFKNQVDNLMIVVGNIGKAFVDDIAVGATQGARSMLTFITSARGAQVVSTIIGTVAGGFSALKEILFPITSTIGPNIKELFESMSGLLNDLTGETSNAASASKLLNTASVAIASGFTIGTKVVSVFIESIGNAVVVVRESIGIFTDFGKVLTGELTLRDVGTRMRVATQAVQDLIYGVVVNTGELISTTIEEFARFSDDVVNNAHDTEVVYTTTFNAVSNNVLANFNAMFTGQDDFINNFLNANQDFLNAVAEQEDEALENSATAWADNWNKKVKVVQTAFDAISNVFDVGFDILNLMQQNKLDAQLNTLNAELKSREDAIKGNFDKGIISQEDYEKQKEALDAESKSKINAAMLAQFENDKKAKRGQAFMNAASAIMGWWAQAPPLGPVAGPAFATGMTLATGIQLALQLKAIKQQTFTPRRNGGPANGFVRMHEDGGELTVLPDGSTIIPHDLSKEKLNGQQILNVSFAGANINSAMDLETVTQHVANKLGKVLRLNR